MSLLSTLAALSLALSPITAPGIVTSCDISSKFTFQTGTLNPPAPLPNTNTTVSVSFSNNYQVVEDGTVDFLINLNGLPYTYTEPLCTINLPCPIALGNHIVLSNPINVTDLTGKLVIQSHYKDNSGELLLCLKTVMSLPN